MFSCKLVKFLPDVLKALFYKDYGAIDDNWRVKGVEHVLAGPRVHVQEIMELMSF